MSVAAGTNGPVIVGIGEALFDVFDGDARLGGAPLNVAVHAHRLLQRLGDAHSPGSGVVVSRVGEDELGHELLAKLRAEGLNDAFVQRGGELPTGRVTVEKLEAGGHRFHIEPGAWDAIAWTPSLEELAKRASAVAFGSLAQRSPTSRATIQRFVGAASDAIKLFDVNLRSSDGEDFFDADGLKRGCLLADYVKLNDEELATVNRLTGTDSAEALLKVFGLSGVIFTRGAKGTAAFTPSGWVEGRPAAPIDADPDADTVGAGDSCTAAILASLVVGRSLQRALDLANEVAAFVAHRPGATPVLPASIGE